MISEIKARRQANVGQALSMLDLASVSDLETKRSLLSIAARCLHDKEVARRWIALAQDESDGELRRAMIAGLKGVPIPDLGATVTLLTSSLAVEPARAVAVEELGRLIVHAPEAIDRLIEAYRRQARTSVKRHILTVLLRFEEPKVLDFLAAAASELPTGGNQEQLVREFQQAVQTLAMTGKMDAIARLQQEFQEQIGIDHEPLKRAIVERLLRHDRFDPRWLRPTEPVSIRRRALAHMLDRSMPCDESLLNDPDPECRLWVVRILAAVGNANALLHCIRTDRDPRVRKAALGALEDSMEPTPALIESLRTETSQENVELVLRKLAPLVARSGQVRTALLSILGPDLKASIAKSIYEILGRAMTRELFEIFLDTYASAKEDRVRAAVLQALSTWHEPDERLALLYVAALRSPQREIRGWGAEGLILLPMTESNLSAIGAGAMALLELPYETAVRLAEKIVKIPNPDEEVRAALRKVADGPEDDELRRLCRKVTDRTVDWDAWLRRVTIEHSVEGIFPEIYSAYDSHPEAARQILRTALLHPECRSHDVSPVSILEFLISKQGLDDDLCRFCLDNAGTYLAFLKLRPDFPELKERIWEVLGKQANPVLLRELLIMIFGSDEAAGEAVRARFVKGSKPWTSFLEANRLWPPAKELLTEPPKKGPGLADE